MTKYHEEESVEERDILMFKQSWTDPIRKRKNQFYHNRSKCYAISKGAKGLRSMDNGSERLSPYFSFAMDYDSSVQVPARIIDSLIEN